MAIKLTTRKGTSFIDCPICGYSHRFNENEFNDGDIVQCTECGKEFQFEKDKLYFKSMINFGVKSGNNINAKKAEDRNVLKLLDISRYVNLSIYIIFLFLYTVALVDNYTSYLETINKILIESFIACVIISTIFHGIIHIALSYLKGIYFNIIEIADKKYEQK